MGAGAADPFPNYTQVPDPIPQAAWRGARIGSVVFLLGVCALLLADPDAGLDLWWTVLVPLLPLVWFVAPGLWRNVCPLAAANQVPRVLGFTRGITAPGWFRTYAPLAGIAIFLGAVFSRPLVFEDSGPATAALIGGALVAAFAGGYVLKGKSGWCSSLCPMLPVQRMYGQTPFANVPNSHCRPCVGCTKNCFDFNPKVAFLADVHDGDRQWSTTRKLFVAAFPGLVIAFFTVPEPDGAVEHVARMALAVAASAGSFLALEALLPASVPKLAAVYGAVAINLFYWWAAPGPDWIAWSLRALVLALTVSWLRRTFAKERVFLERQGLPVPPRAARLGRGARRALEGGPEVTFEDGPRIVAKPGTPLLDLAEGADQPIEAGCRMGVCGADPVSIVSGMEHLSPVAGDEKATLERLGLDPALNRMACCARVQGPVQVSTTPRRDSNVVVTIPFAFDPDVRRVVVVGNGIAGVTAADHMRRRHPDCAIEVVAAEPHPLYNRMGISRLIYGRSAMVGLHLLPDAWYDDNRVTCWLNTRAVAIDRDAGEVVLGTGERLAFDRLILATGSEAHVPEVPGFGGPGSFVLRTASDALAIREYVQRVGVEHAVVAGGGLLGLEAAYAVHKLGLRTTVLERSPYLLRRQLDAAAGGLLRSYLENLGIEVLVDARTEALEDGHVALADGRRVNAGVFLVAAGIEPAVELARRAGLEVGRGVLVDDHLRTSDERIFAIGDLAEWQGSVLGLWPVAVDQAEVAAENAVGGSRAYAGTVPVTMLKVVGVELLSIGMIEGPTEIAVTEEESLRYRKLVLDEEGRAVGAILLGHPEHVQAVTAAVRERLPLGERAEALAGGDWGQILR
jgi:NADPH-dependent 2,4-dienoyl-CoA reductase/sulfur reductase-like enzyme/ferredoxin